MASLNDYIASLSKNKPNYGGLFSNLAAPSGDIFRPMAQTTPATLLPPVKPTVPLSSPAATTPTPTTIAPPVKSTPSSPAQTQYVNSLTQSSPTLPPPPITTNTGTGTGAGNSSITNLGAYQDYLAQYADSLKTSDETTAARANVAKLNADLAQQNLDSRKQIEDDITRQGGLVRGNELIANRDSRENSYKLANAGLAASGAADALSALTGSATERTNSLKGLLDVAKPLQIGDSYIDPTTGKIIYSKPIDTSFSLSEGQARYEKDPVTGQYKQIAIVPKTSVSGGSGSGSTGTYTPGENPSVDAWANRIQNGTAKITDIPASQYALRNSVTVALDAMGNSADGKPTTTELGKAALETAKSLRDKFDAGTGTSVVGGSRVFGGALAGITPGSDASNFRNDFNALKSQLSLEAVKYLKGQGAVSDAERALLAQAVTKLNLSQSDAEFKKTLDGIINKLSTGSSTTAPTILVKNGQSFDASALSPEELQQAIADGYTQQ